MSSEDGAPESFYCAITGEMMREPVIDREGFTYEKHAIETWLEKSSSSPMTRNVMRKSELVPNRALKDVIDEYRHKHGNMAPDYLCRHCHAHFSTQTSLASHVASTHRPKDQDDDDGFGSYVMKGLLFVGALGLGALAGAAAVKGLEDNVKKESVKKHDGRHR